MPWNSPKNRVLLTNLKVSKYISESKNRTEISKKQKNKQHKIV